MKQNLCAGYAEAVVTPPMGVNVPGYFVVRLSDGVITDLHIRAAAFTCGEKKAIFFSCEALGVHAPAAAVIRSIVSERCGVPEEAITIACNHSHTALRIYAPSEKNNTNDIFLRRLFQQFADTAQFAFEDLKPCSFRTVIRDAPGICFKRRYRMKDGSAMTNPPKEKWGEILGPIGKTDDSVRLIRVIREGGKELLLVCFGMHADNIGGTRFCADYSGFMTENLKGAFGGGVEVLFFNGCEGDSITESRMPQDGPFPSRKNQALSRRAGRKLAGAVLEMYDDAKEVNAAGFDFTTLTVKVGKNSYDPAYVPTARMIRDLYLKTYNAHSPELKGYNVPEAMRIMANLERPEFFHLKLSAVRMGDIVFLGIPGEPFQEIGTVIKEKSPFPVTVVTALTNGHEGYFPTREAFESGGYERSTSPYAWDVAECMENAALDGLNELYKK